MHMLQSLFRCWIMLMVFHRLHYDKALVVALSPSKYWHLNTHQTHQIVQDFIVTFHEYPVENFHSVLRARTNETDAAEQLQKKAKDIDVCKNEMQSFQSSFVPPRKFNCSRKSINILKA